MMLGARNKRQRYVARDHATVQSCLISLRVVLAM